MQLKLSVSRPIKVWLFGLFVFIVVCSAAQSANLPEPTGEVILTVTGNIAYTNSDKGAQFDVAMLKEFELITKRIDTPWSKRGAQFNGVLTRELLQLVGAEGSWARASAANDYQVNIPLTDLTQFDTLLAMRMDGEQLTLRDYGPLWLLYSEDHRPKLADSVLQSRMIWQLESLHIK